jgi:hypothetical protein
MNLIGNGMNLKLLNIVGVSDLINRLGEIVDNIVNNQTEKEKLRLELSKELLKLDIQTDSWLSKNVRPLVLITTIIFFVLFAVLDGNCIEIKAQYVDFMGKMVWSLTGAYFGLRELGKQLIKKK